MTTNVNVTPTSEEPTVVETPSPNENWQEDSRLDDNGNPVETPVVEPVVEESSPAQEEEAEAVETDEAKLDEAEVVEAKPLPKFDSDEAERVRPFLEEAGLTPSEVATAVTSANGEVSIEIMQKLVEKHGEGVAGLIADKLKGLHTSNVTAAKAADGKIFDQVKSAFKDITDQSGADTFKELATWAKKALPVADREEINGLLRQGGKAAELAISSLVDSFKKSDSFISQPAKLVAGDNSVNEYGSKPLDKSGYNRELRKLMDNGHNYETSPEIASLNSRRTKSIARGY
jgi:hypothetical protein